MTEKEENVTMSKNTIVALILGAMFLLAAFQTIQLSELKQEVNTQKTTIEGMMGNAALSAAPTGQASGSAALPQSLQNVPDMVGGC
ncbi:MAG: hypothetical protein NUV67_01750 [archaeon]|nr:hypothetical protein [archaeon]